MSLTDRLRFFGDELRESGDELLAILPALGLVILLAAFTAVVPFSLAGLFWIFLKIGSVLFQ